LEPENRSSRGARAPASGLRRRRSEIERVSRAGARREGATRAARRLSALRGPAGGAYHLNLHDASDFRSALRRPEP